MTTQNEVSVRAGMGLLGWLGLLFVGLKLTGFITWSWWLVLLPWLIGPAILVIFLIVAFMALR